MPGSYGSVTAPAGGAFAITPSDTGALYTTSLYVGGTGNLAVDMENGDTVTFNSVPVGVFPIRVRRVYSTGTTATNIIGLR